MIEIANVVLACIILPILMIPLVYLFARVLRAPMKRPSYLSEDEDLYWDMVDYFEHDLDDFFGQ